MATLGLKEMGKFLWEGREKVLPCWLSQFSVLLENVKKNLVFYFEGGRHAYFHQKSVVKEHPKQICASKRILILYKQMRTST